MLHLQIFAFETVKNIKIILTFEGQKYFHTQTHLQSINQINSYQVNGSAF